VETIKGSNENVNAEIPKGTRVARSRPCCDEAPILFLIVEKRASNLPRRNPRKFSSTAVAIMRMNHGTMIQAGI
jgi:hypothetical protein